MNLTLFKIVFHLGIYGPCTLQQMAPDMGMEPGVLRPYLETYVADGTLQMEDDSYDLSPLLRNAAEDLKLRPFQGVY